jgi:hypothetical protein
MSEFFKSEMVRGDLQEMAELQQFCMRSMYAFPVLTTEKQIEYFDTLIQLIEKQKVFYARLALSEDEEAQSMVKSMKESVVLLGGEPTDDMYEMFDNLIKKVQSMKEVAESNL